jgi:hypothetical protein
MAHGERRLARGRPMELDTTLTFDGPPSAAAYMLAAVLRPRRPPRTGGVEFPPLRIRWTGFTTSSRDRLAFQRMTGLGDEARLDLLLPHFTGFRALMVLLTHSTFPLPIWRALQVRNGLRLLQETDDQEPVLEAWVAGQRVLENGVEVDLRSSLRSRGKPVWESLNTFYYRGSFPRTGDASTAPIRPPSADGPVVATWTAARGLGLKAGRLTGDYNPVHWSDVYARRLGFARGSFLHPQVAIGQCLARLPAPSRGSPFHLDTWIRGQVHAGLEVALRMSREPGGSVFELRSGTEARPALIGRTSERAQAGAWDYDSR